MPTPAWTDPVDFAFEEQPSSAKLNAQILANLRFLKPLFARKTVIESVTASTGLQNDDHLFLPVDANATYEIEMVLFTYGDAAGDFKFLFTMPAGATINASVAYFDTALALQNAHATNAAAFATGTLLTVDTPVTLKGIFRTAGAAGTLQLQWAQNPPPPTATQLLVDSYLRLRRVA